MLTRLKNTWRPANFHLHHKLGNNEACFEGWYFKLVDAAGAQPRAVIPGVFLGPDAHAFIQVLDGAAGSSAYHRFRLDEFRADAHDFNIHIGRSSFSRDRLVLDITPDDTDCKQSVQGTVRCSGWSGWPVTLTSPGVMGPYGFVPFMECNHGILSMDHGLAGDLAVDGMVTSYEGGRGYCEKDWGRGFPQGYVWAQSNHFAESGVSLSASVARIPWLTGSFRGFLIGLLLRGRLYRFTTYTGASIERLSVDEWGYRLSVRNRQFRLAISASRAAGALLHAPYERQMVARVAETMTSTVDLSLQCCSSGDILFEGRGEHGCLEVQGDLDSILEHGS